MASSDKVAEGVARLDLSAGANGQATSTNESTIPIPAATTTQTNEALLSEPADASSASKTAAPAVGAGTEQVITPWDVEGAIVDGKQIGIDYNKLIEQFGTKRIDEELLARFERVTGHRPHLLLRRGMFFSHR